MAPSKITKRDKNCIGQRDKNYIRLQALVSKTLTNTVRDVFNKTPGLEPKKLNATLRANKRLNVLTAPQRQILYPVSGTGAKVNDMDLTLMVTLIRNLGNLREPSTFDWQSLPKPTEKNMYHDIVRAKHYRNKYLYAKSGPTNVEFETDWKDISGAILRLVPARKRRNYERQIEEVKSLIFDDENLARCQIELKTLTAKGMRQLRSKFDDASRYVLSLEDKIAKILAGTKSSELVIKKHQTKNKEAIMKHQTTNKEEVKEAFKTVLSSHGKKCARKTRAIVRQELKRNAKEIPVAAHSHAPWEDVAVRLKESYNNEGYRTVKSVMSYDGNDLFDVTSNRYMQLDCTPLEMRCKLVNKETSSKKRKKWIPHSCDSTKKKSKLANFAKIDIGDHVAEDHSYTQRGNHETAIPSTSNGPKSETSVEKSQPNTTTEITKLFSKDANPDLLPVLFEADAGVGKTTLFHRLALDWANNKCGDMKRFKFVFLISLRRVKSRRLVDIICDDMKLFKPILKKDVERCLELYEKDSLFLLDGLDEVGVNPGSHLAKLITGKGKNVFCSSRPTLVGKKTKLQYHGMANFLLVKLLGFSEQTLFNYIKIYFADTEENGKIISEKIMNECKKHLFCKTLIRVPLYANLICYLWKKKNHDIPETATQLFNTFLREVINTYSLKYLMPPHKAIHFENSPLEESVPPPIKRLVKAIAELAYKTLIKKEVVFSSKHAESCFLSVDDMIQIGLFTIEEDGDIIHFRHKLFHEYFAGLFLTSQEAAAEIYSLFTNSRDAIIERSHILQNAFFFASGFSKDAFQRIVFSLNSSSHGKVSRQTHRSFNVKNVNSCPRCSTIATRMLFPGSNGKADTLNEKEINLSVLAFFIQLLFEFNDFDHSHESLKNLSTIPVYCSSSHSLAAACQILEANPKSKRRKRKEIEQRDLDPENDSSESESEESGSDIESRSNDDSLSEVENNSNDETDSDVEWLGSTNKTNSESDSEDDTKEVSISNDTDSNDLEHHNGKSRRTCNKISAAMMSETHDRPKVTQAKSLVFIDGPNFDFEQMICILKECSERTDIKYLTLYKAEKHLIEEMLRVKWSNVEKIGFQECAVIVPLENMLGNFPNLKVVYYDKKTWRRGNKLEKESYDLANITIALQVYEDKTTLAVSEKLKQAENCQYIDALLHKRSGAKKEHISLFIESYDKVHRDQQSYIGSTSIAQKFYCCHSNKKNKNYKDVELDVSTACLSERRLEHRLVFDRGDLEFPVLLLKQCLPESNIVFMDGFLYVWERPSLTPKPILQAYSSREDVQALVFLNTRVETMYNVMEIDWEYVKGVFFQDCEAMIPPVEIASKFPSIKNVYYDETTQKAGESSIVVWPRGVVRDEKFNCVVTLSNDDGLKDWVVLKKMDEFECEACSKQPEQKYLDVTLEPKSNTQSKDLTLLYTAQAKDFISNHCRNESFQGLCFSSLKESCEYHIHGDGFVDLKELVANTIPSLSHLEYVHVPDLSNYNEVQQQYTNITFW